MDNNAQEMGELIASASFRQYAHTFIKIEDKDGAIVPFKMNEAQEIVYAEIGRQIEAKRPIRLLILKGRQQGMSTFCQAFIAWKALTCPGARCLTVGHQLPAVHELFGKFDRIVKELPDLPEAGLPRPKVEERERGRRIRFSDPLRSQYRADSAHEPESVGRGMTIQFAHLTEVPQWNKADETIQAMLPTISPNVNTCVLVETTAKGATGWFYDAWIKAMNALARGEEPQFVPVFVPWYMTKDYARSRRPGEDHLSNSERAWRDLHGISNEQVYWYRDQIDDLGEDKVKEEYPSTWQEAFLSAGRPFFRADAMEFFRTRKRKPLRRGKLLLHKVANRTVGRFAATDDPGRDASPTWIFEEPVPGHRYAMGIDFASGRAKDFNTFVMIDADTNRVVATHASHMLPEAMLTEAALIGKAYNMALLVPERNGIGDSLVRRLVDDLRYPNVFRAEDPAAVQYHRAKHYGWVTSNRTRGWMLEDMANHVHSRTVDIPCERLLREMDTFVYIDAAGQRAEAGGNSHDDLVMAFAMAIQGVASLPALVLDDDIDNEDWAVISSSTGY